MTKLRLAVFSKKESPNALDSSVSTAELEGVCLLDPPQNYLSVEILREQVFAHLTVAIHSISTRAPSARRLTPKALRAGSRSLEK